MFPAPENIHLARCEHKTLLPNGSVWEPSGAQPQHPSMEAPRLSWAEFHTFTIPRDEGSPFATKN